MINNILSAPRFWVEVPTSIFDDMSWGWNNYNDNCMYNCIGTTWRI